MSISRRTFLESATLAGLLAHPAAAFEKDAKTGMPLRVLGKTGAKVSLLGFGSGSRWLMYKEEDKAAEALYTALDAGVNYVDSAQSYGDGESERRLGLFLGERRKQVWLVTKIPDRTHDGLLRAFEQCLGRLRTDHVDLLHMHSLTTEEDLAKILAPNGALKALYKLRDEKSARHIGVTCHSDPAVLKTLIEEADLDCTQMALNAGRMGSGKPSNVRGYSPSFEEIALPAALKKKMGVTAMKVYAQDKLLPDGKPADLVRYAMSLPVASAVIGMPKLEYLNENVQFAKSFRPMTKRDMKRISDQLAAVKKAEIDAYFHQHQDACDACGVQLA